MQQQSCALAARTTLVVMGVSGSGKSEISQGVATALGWRHIEADHFHPSENIERMRADNALSDEDRRHWLDALCEQIQGAQAAGECFVLACSALKARYRDQLRAAAPGLRFVFLELSRDAAAERVANRPGHYMPPALLDSQLGILEPLGADEAGLTLDITLAPSALVERITASR